MMSSQLHSVDPKCESFMLIKNVCPMGRDKKQKNFDWQNQQIDNFWQIELQFIIKIKSDITFEPRVR